MNGISSTLKDEIKKTKDGKQKEKLKFAATILITNIMVAMLCLPSKEAIPAKKAVQKILHPDYQVMTIPLTVLVSETSQSLPENAVTLVSVDKKVIAEKAYLHEKFADPKGIGDSPSFKIEISNADIVRVSEFVSSGMVAVPYVETKKVRTRLAPRGSKYEISI